MIDVLASDAAGTIRPEVSTHDMAAMINFKLYRFTPSLGGASIAVGVFAILSIIHLWLISRTRAIYFIPFLIGGACA